MQMANCLPGRLAQVEADVVAIRRQLGVEFILDLFEEVKDCALLFRAGIEPGRHMSRRDDESVARCDRVAITESQCGSITTDNIFRCQTAKGAGGICGGWFLSGLFFF